MCLSAPSPKTMRCVRWSEELQCFMLRCDECRQRRRPAYVPLLRELWDIHDGMRVCRACHHDRKRETEKRRYRKPEVKARVNQRTLAYHQANKDLLNAKHRDYLKRKKP